VFGEIVRARRRRLGLTQEELAHRSGVSVRGLRKIESGQSDTPRLATVRLLADTLGLDGEDRDRFFQAATGQSADTTPPIAAVPGAASGGRRGLQWPRRSATPAQRVAG